MEQKYLRMLAAMQADDRGAPEWSVYVVRCVDGSLYTGIAKDVDARYRLHERGKGAAYTKTHPPQSLIHREGPFTRSAALIREAQIKRMPKDRKEKFVSDLRVGSRLKPPKPVKSNLV